MKMPTLKDLRKTKEELKLALAELDSLEAATRNIDLAAQNGSHNSNHHQETNAEDVQLKEKVRFLEEANKELSEKNEELLEKFDKVNQEKSRLTKDIDELRNISQKLQVPLNLMYKNCFS